MKYDKNAIGKRIRKERETLGLSQTEFAKLLKFKESSRQVIGNWEKGKVLPHFEYMLEMCKVFNCELGYLLCEYDCKTRVTTDIVKATGLTEDAVNRLIAINNSPISGALDTLSKFVLHEDFGTLFRAMHLHICEFNNKSFRINEQQAQHIAQYMKCHVTEVNAYMESSSRGLIETSFKKILSDIK